MRAIWAAVRLDVMATSMRAAAARRFVIPNGKGNRHNARWKWDGGMNPSHGPRNQHLQSHRERDRDEGDEPSEVRHLAGPAQFHISTTASRPLWRLRSWIDRLLALNNE